jgi:nucleoside-diphosphate-sugar epimerase
VESHPLTGKSLAVFGAGYVGFALAHRARSLGLVVHALTRNTDTATLLRESEIPTVVADLSSHDWHERMPPADFVVNCVSSSGGGAAGYEHSYVRGTESIVDWLKTHQKTDTLVYTSSTSVYPQSGGVVDEFSPVEPAEGTARILLEAENRVRSAFALHACRRAFVLRLAGIYGPGRHHLLDQLRDGVAPLPGKGDHQLNLIHRDDIVSAILAALQAPTANEMDTLNVCDDGPAPKCEVVAWLAQRIGVPYPSFSGETVPRRRSNPANRVISNAKIKKVLGWSPQYPDFRAGYAALLGA